MGSALPGVSPAHELPAACPVGDCATMGQGLLEDSGRSRLYRGAARAGVWPTTERADQMASSNKLTRQAKELRAALGISLSEAKRQIDSATDGYAWNLLGIKDLVTYKPAQHWNVVNTSGPLHFTVGGDVTGKPLVVDLAESALGGHGPHWLITTAPGNDAAGLLQFVAADLATRYAPSRLQMAVFGDLSALRALEGLPHIVPESVGLEPTQWQEWVERLVAARTGALSALKVDDWRAYRQLPIESQTLAELVMFIVPGESDEEPLADLALRCGRALGIHVILCTPKSTALEGHFALSLRMTEPQTKEQVGALLAQLQRERPNSVVVGDADDVPAGAGILTVRGDTAEIWNFRAYPPPPIQELARRQAAEQAKRGAAGTT